MRELGVGKAVEDEAEAIGVGIGEGLLPRDELDA